MGKVTAVIGSRLPTGNRKYMKKRQKRGYRSRKEQISPRSLSGPSASLRRQSPLLREQADHLTIENRKVRRLPAAYPVSVAHKLFIFPTRTCVADVVLNRVIAGHRAVSDTTS